VLKPETDVKPLGGSPLQWKPLAGGQEFSVPPQTCPTAMPPALLKTRLFSRGRRA